MRIARSEDAHLAIANEEESPVRLKIFKQGEQHEPFQVKCSVINGKLFLRPGSLQCQRMQAVGKAVYSISL